MSIQLTPPEGERLRRLSGRLVELLSVSGLTRQEVGERLQLDLDDIFERRSAADPYEQLRARVFVSQHSDLINEKKNDWVFCTWANPRLRVSVGELHRVDPEHTFRSIRRKLQQLKSKYPDLIIVMVFEVNLCRPLEGPEFYEPHVHLIVKGAPEDEVRGALKTRKLASITIRKRPVQVKPVKKKFHKALRYLTKLKPQLRNQYIKIVDGKEKRRWRANDLRGSELVEWTKFMSEFSVADLLKFHGIDGRDLRLAGRAELSLPRPSGLARSPLRPSRSP